MGCKSLPTNLVDPNGYGISGVMGYQVHGLREFRLYNRETKQVFSSYHICFLESCDGHLPTPPDVPTENTTLESIIKSATPTPIFFDEDDNELLPPINPPQTNPSAKTDDPDTTSQPENNPDKTPQLKTVLQSTPPIPEETVPRCSSHIAEKTPNAGPSRLEKVIKESTDAAVRLKAAQTERKKTLQDLREEEARNAPKVVKDTAIEELPQAFGTLNLREGTVEQIDQVLSAISGMSKINPSTLEFEDEPKTWEEACQSTNTKRWEEGYCNELKSLKDMGVYKLIPRSDVPQGSKVRKG